MVKVIFIPSTKSPLVTLVELLLVLKDVSDNDPAVVLNEPFWVRFCPLPLIVIEVGDNVPAFDFTKTN